jgi:spore germination cell wall hydrolase CwlJ-like protein
MFPTLRSALLICAALTAITVAPAQAGPSTEPPTPASVSIPEVPLADLLDPDSEPLLSGGDTQDPLVGEATDDVDPTTATPDVPAATSEVPAIATGDLASKVAQLRASDPGSRELECLSAGIYFEAKSEPLAGQLAVGQVIANRAESGGRFPSSYCGVLFQRGQFSFIRGRSWPVVNRGSRQWQNAVAIAKIVARDLHESAVGKALFFHARYVSPRWRLKRVASIGNHIFYR